MVIASDSGFLSSDGTEVFVKVDKVMINSVWLSNLPVSSRGLGLKRSCILFTVDPCTRANQQKNLSRKKKSKVLKWPSQSPVKSDRTFVMVT